MTIPEAVVHLRKVVCGESQEAFAHRLGMSTQSIHRYERGTSPPETLALIKFGGLAREKGREDLSGVFGATVPFYCCPHCGKPLS